MPQKSVLEERLKEMLADPEKHGPILQGLLETIKTGGNKALKKQIQEWISQIKAKEGLE